jgi:hypothetical protein
MRSTFNASFLKSLIFLIKSTLILLVFKKKIQNTKNKKNQNLQKERSRVTMFEDQTIFCL